LEEEDILISLGMYHNKIGEVTKIIEEKTKLIYEIAKSYSDDEFILNLDNMEVVTPDLFTDAFPVRGLNTLFMIDNSAYGGFNCMVNNISTTTNAEMFIWFISFIMSGLCCVAPMSNTKDYFGVQLFQTLSYLFYSGGKTTGLVVNSQLNMLTCPMNDLKSIIIYSPGKEKRLKELIAKSIEQMGKNRKQK